MPKIQSSLATQLGRIAENPAATELHLAAGQIFLQMRFQFGVHACGEERIYAYATPTQISSFGLYLLPLGSLNVNVPKLWQ